MRTFAIALAAASLVALPAAADAQSRSSGRKAQDKGMAEIPRCTRSLGTIALVDPDDQWWLRYDLQSPQVLLKVFVQRSGCFTLVNRDRALGSRSLERALADNGELQRGSNVGRGQVRTADYFLQADLAGKNENSGGNSLGGLARGLLGRVAGGLVGGLDVRKKEANVTLSVVNARTTEEQALTEGYARKSDISFRGAGGLGGLFGGAVAGIGGYENTEIGQVITLAYLDAYTKLVSQLGGLAPNASAAAPQSTGNASTDERAAYDPGAGDAGGSNLASAYDRLKDGMSVAQVDKIVGFAGREENSGSGVRTMVWADGDAFILGTFNRNKLAYKSKNGF